MTRRHLRFSWLRFWGILLKEFIQMRRDRVTFGMMVGVPVVQLLLFGYAINTDPRHLPTLIEVSEESAISRAIVGAMRASEYFEIIGEVSGPQAGAEALAQGRANLILTLPVGFERDLIRGRSPEILLAADASDPTATAAAMSAIERIVETALADTLTGPLARAALPPAVEVIRHRAYNPEGRSATNIVPGLLSIILAMTLVMMTAVAIVRESEKGTMEMLIATPAQPLEVMGGKILPYVVVGYVQTAVFMLAARTLFDVPFTGSVAAFLAGFNLYLIGNLALGFLISTIARNQMQAMQISFFTLLPQILLSGFMFPFAGMPLWAQWLGNALPATHFLRLTREVMLKGGGWASSADDMARIGVIGAVIVTLALLRYRQTLD